LSRSVTVTITSYVPEVTYECEPLKLRTPAARLSGDVLPSPHANRTVSVSSVPGSLNVPLTVTVWWSVTDDGEKVRLDSDGDTFIAVTVVPPATHSPPPSVTVTATVYVPESR